MLVNDFFHRPTFDKREIELLLRGRRWWWWRIGGVIDHWLWILIRRIDNQTVVLDQVKLVVFVVGLSQLEIDGRLSIRRGCTGNILVASIFIQNLQKLVTVNLGHLTVTGVQREIDLESSSGVLNILYKLL